MRHFRVEELARPREISPYFIPDRISVYWLDYLIDETPRKITNPNELYDYYQASRKSFPRTEKLAEARHGHGHGQNLEDRATTAYGIPISALTYKASGRIRKLSMPIEREKDVRPFPANRPLTAILLGDKYNWYNQAADLLGTGDFQSRSRIRRQKQRPDEKSRLRPKPWIPNGHRTSNTSLYKFNDGKNESQLKSRIRPVTSKYNCKIPAESNPT